MICDKKTRAQNYQRHSAAQHLFCLNCMSLGSKAKHPCFGARSLKRSTIFLQQSSNGGLLPLTSNIFAPIEVRSDLAKAILPVLSARGVFDDCIYAPLFFLLSLHWCRCLMCRAKIVLTSQLDRDSLIQISTFHSCAENVEQSLADYFELTCAIFNVEPTETIKAWFKQALITNSCAQNNSL